jgi:hypothetical protein
VKILANVRVGSRNSRLDAEQIAAQLRADIERELQASLASEQRLDPEERRAAVERAVRRLAGIMI